VCSVVSQAFAKNYRSHANEGQTTENTEYTETQRKRHLDGEHGAN